ncbi:MAG: glycosyltransferase, partial [Deltaproteobacteria bacterium]|nr:glycosyltransferase [Deltaproteobacteria bacterium]
ARSKEMVARWLGPDRMICPQQGSDLGERMKNAFRDVISRGSTRAVLIGSDIPDLPQSFIDEAFTSLEDHDAVLGPSLDGGYYLIGFRSDSFLPEVFDGVQWSTPAVFQQTLGILQKSKYSVHTLRERRDIDTFDDLAAFFRDNLSASPAPAATMGYVRSHIPDISRGPHHDHK